MIANLLTIIALLALAVASYIDIRIREVPDWISYGLIFAGLGLRSIDSTVIWSFKPIISGLMGLGFTFIMALLMYYSGIWGGGDSKLLMGLGAIIGIERFDTLPFLFIFILAAFIVSGIYGFFYAVYLASRHWKNFKKEFNEINARKHVFIARIVSDIILVLAVINFYSNRQFYSLMIVVSITVIFLAIRSWVLMKAVEKSALITHKKTKDLVEGDWIVKEIKVKGRRICGPKDLGITKHQIELLKIHRVKSVLVKDGIPFVPSFFIAYILTLIYSKIY